jgi:uncharacterized protein
LSNLDSVKAVYEGFATGDIPKVLGTFSPDIAWNHGPRGVLEGVFMRLGSEWEGFAAVPDEFIDAGDTVVVLGKYSGKYKTSGKSFQANFAHVWRMREGKATQFTQYVDTLLVHRALQ